MSVLYFKNNKTDDYTALQIDGSAVNVNPIRNTIMNPSNFYLFFDNEDVLNYKNLIASRNHLEIIEGDEFIKILDKTFGEIVSIVADLNYKSISKLDRREILINIEKRNKSYK